MRQGLSYHGTKSPLADSRAERGRESDIYLVRASAHPRGAFLYNKKSGEISYCMKKNFAPRNSPPAAGLRSRQLPAIIDCLSSQCDPRGAFFIQ